MEDFIHSVSGAVNPHRMRYARESGPLRQPQDIADSQWTAAGRPPGQVGTCATGDVLIWKRHRESTGSRGEDMEKARAAVLGDAMRPVDTGARSVGDAPEDNDSGGADIAETARATEVIDALMSMH